MRNRRDGSVETLVAGRPDAVEDFLIAARRGPATARIDSHRIEEGDDAVLRVGGGEHGFVAATQVEIDRSYAGCHRPPVI